MDGEDLLRRKLNSSQPATNIKLGKGNFKPMKVLIYYVTILPNQINDFRDFREIFNYPTAYASMHGIGSIVVPFVYKGETYELESIKFIGHKHLGFSEEYKIVFRESDFIANSEGLPMERLSFSY